MEKAIQTTEDRIKALKIIAETAKRVDRIPQKKDFDIQELIYVKDVLGPLPRALEIAGMKEESVHYKKRKARREKRKLEARKKKREEATHMHESEIRGHKEDQKAKGNGEIADE